MTTIVNIDDNTFSINGIKYKKIFVAVPAGNDSIRIVSAYDSRFEVLSVTKVTDVTVDGVSAATQAELVSAVIDIILNRISPADVTGKLDKDGYTGTADDLDKKIDAIATGEMGALYPNVVGDPATLAGIKVDDTPTYAAPTEDGKYYPRPITTESTIVTYRFDDGNGGTIDIDVSDADFSNTTVVIYKVGNQYQKDVLPLGFEVPEIPPASPTVTLGDKNPVQSGAVFTALQAKKDVYKPISVTNAPITVIESTVNGVNYKTAKEQFANASFDFHKINDVSGNGYAGAALGDDANAQASRLIGGTGGVFPRRTTVNEIQFIWTTDPNSIAVAPAGAKVQLIHIRTDDGGTSYRLEQYIGEYEIQPEKTGIGSIKYLSIILEPTDLIVARGFGRKLMTVSNPTIAGTLNEFERVTFGNTSSLSPTAIFTDKETTLTPNGVNNGFGPAMNLIGVETSASYARNVEFAPAILGPDKRVKDISSPYFDGITGAKVVACGTSITAGAQARTDGGTEWVGLLGENGGFEMINEAQGSSQIVFPKKDSRIGDPRCLYDLLVTGDATANTFEFTNKTLAQIGINATGIKFSFIGASQPADPTALYPDISSPIYTVVSIVDANTVEVADVSDSVSFRADYITDTAVSGVIRPPISSSSACLSATAAELQRLATLGDFNFADYGYETRIIAHNPDILLISHMYNDGIDNIKDIGAIDSQKKSEFLGAYNYVVDKAYEQNPYVRIMVLTNFSAYRGNNLPAEQHLLDQRNAMLEWAKYRNIPVIDQMFAYGCEPGVNWNDSDPGVASGEGLVPDGTHPGRILHKRMYKFILPKFLQLAV